MRHVRSAALALSLAGLSWVIGCGDDGGGSSSAPSPSSTQAATAQQAAAADGATNEATNAATEAVVDGGSGGATSSKATDSQAPSVAFNFTGSIDVIVDLDALNSQGNDRFPNSTGRISVAASGTVTGTSQSGQASYAVQVTVLTDVVYRDPVSGNQGRILAGASWTYGLVVSWSWTDAMNWTISAAADAQLSGVEVTVQSGTEVVTATVSGTRETSGTWERSAGLLTGSTSWTGLKTITWTDGTSSHEVVILVESATSIYITVDGVTFGPYTAAEIVALIRARIF